MILRLLAAFSVLCTANLSAQTVEIPQRSFLNLYQVTKEITNDPAPLYDPDHGSKPDFPYPTDIEKQWRTSIQFHGNELPPAEHKLLLDCAGYMIDAIDGMERGYRIKLTQPGNDKAQESADSLYAHARRRFALCKDAYDFESQPGAAPPQGPNQPQSGGLEAQPPLDGSAEEAALPGSIDWTAALDPLFTYLGREWQKETVQQKYVPNDEPNTLTLLIQRGQPPVTSDVSGTWSRLFNNMVQSSHMPTPNFPANSTLNSLLLSSVFFMQTSPRSKDPTNKLARQRYKYYERDGIFKRYLSKQP